MCVLAKSWALLWWPWFEAEGLLITLAGWDDTHGCVYTNQGLPSDARIPPKYSWEFGSNLILERKAGVWGFVLFWFVLLTKEKMGKIWELPTKIPCTCLTVVLGEVYLTIISFTLQQWEFINPLFGEYMV